MTNHPIIAGVFTAAITPLDENGALDLEHTPQLLDFLRRRGCHGVLLFGTTGEGPSFSPQERLSLLDVALDYREAYPDFRLLLGTGTPSLDETLQLTRAAFERGADGVVVLPPYFYRKVSDDGLFAWFSRILSEATPSGGAFLGYHIPGVSGVPLSIELLARLKDVFPDRFTGIKDSSSDPDHARALGERFGSDLVVFSGNDRLFTLALDNHAGGCITAMANLVSPSLRRVWDAHREGRTAPDAEMILEAGRAIFEAYPPAPPLLKALITRIYGLPRWVVRPPLTLLPSELEDRALQEALEKLDIT